MDVTSALYKYGKEQAGMGKNSFVIGPLLSCTNMVSGERHYVDLTFLATARGDIQACIQDEAGHRYVDDSEKMWYDFSSMCKFYDEAQLFPPVANAFERFCVLSAFDGVPSELQRRFLSSSQDARRQPAFRSRVIPSLPDTSEIAQWLVGAKVTNEISPMFFERRTGAVK
jgi:hypothetical protein